jgi:hypothetical protein
MANTLIQFKSSLVTSAPPTLNVAEPAYSYASNTLFIGSPNSDAAIPIGGKFYLDQQQLIYNTVNAAFTAANTANAATSGKPKTTSAIDIKRIEAISSMFDNIIDAIDATDDIDKKILRYT